MKREQSRERGEEKKEEKDTAAVASDGDVVIIYDDGCVNLTCQDSTWVIRLPHSMLLLGVTSSHPTLVVIFVVLGWVWGI